MKEGRKGVKDKLEKRTRVTKRENNRYERSS
jgi:hypothetical protein